MTPAKFIAIEGIEGAGKTSCIPHIQDYLEKRGIAVVCTREPGGTPLAEEIRELVLKPREEPVSPDCELLLMYAARVQHVMRVIRPALAENKWVISDRFSDATAAYQGAGRGLGVGRVRDLDRWALFGFAPDCVIILDVEVERGLMRAGNRSAPDRFEQERIAFFERVRRYYLATAHTDPRRYRIVDAGQRLENVKSQLNRVLEDLISR